MALSRVEQLRTVSISNLIQDIFHKEIPYSDISHHEDPRNYVVIVDGKYVLKVYGDKDRWKGEVENLARIHPAGFHIPHLIDYGMVNPYNGWVMTNLLPGTIMEKENQYLDSKEKKAVWYKLGECFFQFHNANIANYKDTVVYSRKPPFPDLTYWDSITIQYTEQKERIIKNDFYGSENEYSKAFIQIENWLAQQKKKDTIPLVLCHNDFSTRNILYQPASFGLIDFEMGCYAPRESDFTRLAMELQKGGLFEAFLDGYYSGQAPVLERNPETIRMFILIKTVEICSWAYSRANDYYHLAFDMLKSISK